MNKPKVRGPSSGRKAHLALRDKLNRKSKPPPPLPLPKKDKKSGAKLAETTESELPYGWK
jgi:hypothetical protein